MDKLLTSQCKEPRGTIPGQGTRSYLPPLKIAPLKKIPRAATETGHSPYIHTYILFFKEKETTFSRKKSLMPLNGLVGPE